MNNGIKLHNVNYSHNELVAYCNADDEDRANEVVCEKILQCGHEVNPQTFRIFRAQLSYFLQVRGFYPEWA